jgi:hypothetical protein
MYDAFFPAHPKWIEDGCGRTAMVSACACSCERNWIEVWACAGELVMGVKERKES